MNFLAPELLLGLLLIPVAIGFYLWAQRRRSRYAVRFTNLDLLANLDPDAGRPGAATCRRSSTSARSPRCSSGSPDPRWSWPRPREDATILLAMDVSGSMRATDVAPTRLDAAKAAAISFIDQIPEGVRVGIVSFASAAEHARLADDRPGRTRRTPSRASGHATAPPWATP